VNFYQGLSPAKKLEGFAGAHEWPFGAFGGIILESREVAKENFLVPLRGFAGHF
jgi:hypothetical protein